MTKFSVNGRNNIYTFNMIRERNPLIEWLKLVDKNEFENLLTYFYLDKNNIFIFKNLAKYWNLLLPFCTPSLLTRPRPCAIQKFYGPTHRNANPHEQSAPKNES